MDVTLSDLLDALLAAALVGSAGIALHGASAIRAVITFLVFGFLMTLVWVRLNSPDLAFAEAAVGAGVTGALLILLLSRLRTRHD